MSEKQETIDDYVSATKNFSRMIPPPYGKRIEAAAMRGRESITPKPDPDWKDICAKCVDGDIEPEHCKYYGEPNGCNSPIYGEHPTTEKSSAVGNAAKMREALEKIRSNLTMTYQSEEEERNLIVEAFNIAGEALAAPPRNCDVGTAEEQFKRFLAFCHRESRGCQHCPASKTRLRGTSNCDLAWAQMPYETEEGEAE